MPSARYSCSGSPERFSSGSTAMDSMRGAIPLPNNFSRAAPIFNTASAAKRATAPPAISHKLTGETISAARGGRPRSALQQSSQVHSQLFGRLEAVLLLLSLTLEDDSFQFR